MFIVKSILEKRLKIRQQKKYYFNNHIIILKRETEAAELNPRTLIYIKDKLPAQLSINQEITIVKISYINKA